ncbi:pyridoxal phosphate-dependent decarboxylase family protein [Pseudonocardia sp. CA-107938]|uniref:pyridoxal phosphate-dependent decarboxylase family protein n=1 Tax=Pseudonocardia sp. CA-107938 TaxID=3240021 RepID=UPI003D8ABBB5
MTIPLRLPPAEMRRLGHRAADLVVEHLSTQRTQPVGGPPDPELLAGLFDSRLPDAPTDPVDVLEEVVRDVLATIVRTDHPRFLAYVPGPSNYVGAVADFVAAGLNVFAGQGLVAPGPAVMERITVDWLRQLCGLPDGAGGLFVSGGTMATLIAVHAARVHHGAGAVYVSAHTHRSIRRGLGFLGIDDARVRVVPLDHRYRMEVHELRTMLATDRRAGVPPLCVVATAGTTGTGAVDPLDELAEVCAENGAWLHVDGAYGAAAVLSEQHRHLLAGLGRADSVALDPHKWWFQPYEAGCVLVRDVSLLEAAFAMEAEYLRETRADDVPLNFYDLGPQLTRSFRALKMWMSMRTFGLDAFRRAVDHGIGLVEHAEQMLRTSPGWEIVTPAQLAVLTFRPARSGLPPDAVDGLTRRIAAATLRDGRVLVTTTELDGRPVLRLCATHPETSRADIEQAIDVLDELAAANASDSPEAATR